MTAKVQFLMDQLRSGEYKKLRRPFIKEVKIDKDRSVEAAMKVLRAYMEVEEPLLFEGDRFGFNLSASHELQHGPGNVTPNYARILSTGFDATRAEILARIRATDDPEKKAYGEAMVECIDLILAHADKYRAYAKSVGNEELYEALCHVPHGAATSFYEACVFLKLSAYFLRIAYTDHVGLGRCDQYMFPYYEADRARGVSREELFETLESYFIAINRDTDLYTGVQKGDNGQSMMLGGFDAEGNSVYNELSQLCMEASLELSLIDPKINLRVGKNTPDELYVLGTRLTKQGLGFPQYSNDDVVIPGLIKRGYAPEDAQDYTVAACWEFIIPGKGADIPNIETMDFPGVTGRAVRSALARSETFEELMDAVKAELEAECDRLIEGKMQHEERATPLLSIYTDGCIESLTDMWHGGAKYQNYGCHGAGISNAADALEAIRKLVYEEKSVTKETLLTALESDFKGYEELQGRLLSAPKMGNNEEGVDEIACRLMGYFSARMNNRDNGHGGIWRAGTGSAMEYLWKGEKCPATADGRNAGECYGSSFSPALTAKMTGLLSTLQSFTKYDMTEIINGGPLTIEVHDTVLRNDVGIEKVASLVKAFVALGGHQLQLNSINRERLLEAQEHPERYPHLIVRVWGWSGYFNELDVKYQNHIIKRTEFCV